MDRAPDRVLDPPPALVELARRAPVSRVRIWDGSEPWLITGYYAGRTVLADPRVSSDQRLPGYTFVAEQAKVFHTRNRTMPTIDDPEHAALRRKVSGDFANRRMERLRPDFQSELDSIIDGLLSCGNSADVFTDIAVPMSSLAICRVLGVPSSAGKRFNVLGRMMAARTSTAEDHVSAVEGMRDLLGELVDAARIRPSDGVIGHLVAADELDRSEIIAMSLLLMAAGHGATAHMTTLGTMALLAHPEQLSILVADPKPETVAGAVEELLRYLSVAHLGRRRVAKEDIEVEGVLIRKGEGIIVATDTANRDTAAFTGDPDQLDLCRHARHHVAFGFGTHQCLGQQLSRVLLQVIFGTLFRRIPTIRMTVDPTDITYKLGLAIYGVEELPIAW